jgi:hypothetical protein
MFRERLDGMCTDILVRKAVSSSPRQVLTLVELRLRAKLFQCGRRDTRKVCSSAGFSTCRVRKRKPRISAEEPSSTRLPCRFSSQYSFDEAGE